MIADLIRVEILSLEIFVEAGLGGDSQLSSIVERDRRRSILAVGLNNTGSFRPRGLTAV